LALQIDCGILRIRSLVLNVPVVDKDEISDESTNSMLFSGQRTKFKKEFKMNKILKRITFVVIMASLLLTACAPAATAYPPTIQPVIYTQFVSMTVAVEVAAQVTPVPTQGVIVVTATGDGMLDLGTVLTPAITAIAEGQIDWDLGAHSWNIGPGLEAQEVMYMDTGILGSQMVLDHILILPDRAVAICGGTDAKVELVNGFNLAHGGGFYFVLLPHTEIKSLWLQNGFCLIVDEGQAQQEFAARVAQAISSGWGYANVYQPEEWPALTGTYSTPLNSNR